MTRLGAVLAWMLALGTLAAAHEISFSRVDVRLEPGETRVIVELPIKVLLQQQPMPLPVGTTEAILRTAPLPGDVQASLTGLLTTRLQLISGGDALPVTVDRVEPAGEDIALTGAAPSVPGVLEIQANLFPDDPLHKVFVNVFRAGALVGQYALDRQNPTLTLAAPKRPLWEVIASFVRQGIHHIFIGPDHILFVLALVLLGGRLWSQVKIITAFTVAHSITLALATLDIVQLPSRLVESVIALSIVVVGLHDVRQLQRGRAEPAGRDPRTLFAFAFGLVHGFGFASVLVALDLPRQALAWSLAAFNVGVEIGQVVIVLIAAPLIAALNSHARPRLAQGLLTTAACAVVLMGGYWFWQRALGA
jgi:hydrogenase/urease accessory protein HupE